MNIKRLGTYLRTKIGTRNFYEDIIFEVDSTKLKKYILDWRTNLQRYKQLKIEKFKDLLLPLNEIVLPVKINYIHSGLISRLDIEFIDNEGKEYYMIQDTLYDNTYIIGRRNSKLEPLLDRDFTFEIFEDKINLIETGVLKLKEDGTNAEDAVHFYYNLKKNTTEANLKSYSHNRTIKIQYPTMDAEFDKKVLEFLFDINNSKWYHYNVLPILKCIISMLDEKLSISITAEVNKEICSEIDVVEGIVQKYTRTEIINEGKMQIVKEIFAKDVKEFLAENK